MLVENILCIEISVELYIYNVHVRVNLVACNYLQSRFSKRYIIYNVLIQTPRAI